MLSSAVLWPSADAVLVGSCDSTLPYLLQTDLQYCLLPPRNSAEPLTSFGEFLIHVILLCSVLGLVMISESVRAFQHLVAK